MIRNVARLNEFISHLKCVIENMEAEMKKHWKDQVSLLLA